MTTISDAVQLTLEEKIVPTIFESLWAMDPIYPMIARSSTNVVRNRGIGRGWNVLKTWVAGVAGGAKFTSPVGGNVVSGTHNFTMYDTPQSFQAIDEVTAPAFIQTTLQLIEHRGNFYLPHQILRADRLTASIGSVVAQNLKGVGDLLAQQEAALFYSTDTTTYALACLGTTASTMSNKAADTAAIVVDLSETLATGRVHRFRQGMMVDLYDSTGATKRNANFYLVVDNVAPLDQTITLRRVDGDDFQVETVLGGGITYAGAGGDLDVIVIKDSVKVAPNSLESWIAGAAGSFFGISIADHGQFQSYVPTALGAALTESALNRHFAMYYESFPGKKIDAAITTMGVLIGFIDNLDSYNAAVADQPGRFRYDRNGRPMEIEAGWEGFRYRFASRPCEIYTSTYCASGTFYAGKIKNGGITRYVPPSLPGAKVDSRFGTEVEFVATLGGSGGYQGIFKHAHSATGATTDFIEAPFVRQWNCMPTQPNFMKLTGISEVLG
jgi:hypothetical protein